MLNWNADILAQGLRTVREETRIELARWSSGDALLVGLIVTAAALYAVAWMYRREGRGDMGGKLRWTLVVCRVAVLVMLGLIAFEPVLAKYLHRRLDAFTLVVLDESASMSLRDRYRVTADAARVEEVIRPLPDEGVRRSALAERLVNDDGGRFLSDLSDRNPVKVFAFGEQVAPRGMRLRGNGDAGAGTPLSPDGSAVIETIRLEPDGSVTNLGLAVRGAVESVSGSPIAAVILLTDGGFNSGEDPSIVARFLKQKDIPLYAVGIGDPADPINVRVADVTGPRSTFKNDPFSITVEVDAEGVAGETISIELLERDVDSSRPAQVVEAREVTADADGRFAPIVFERKVDEPGTMTYIANVRPLANETVRSDNRREILPVVRILDDKMRVLVIAGGPSYDYRYLTRMLERDATVDLTAWLQSADINAVRDGNTIIRELPIESEQLFEYDVLIFLDASPREFDPTWGSLVATFVVDHGGGLLVAAGRKYAGEFFRSPKTAALIELLPVTPDRDAEILLNAMGHYQTRAWPLLIPEATADDPILRLVDDATGNRAAWASLEGVFWHFPVRRAKPVASVLMQHSNPRMVNGFGPHVLFATQLVGAGRTAFLGFDSTWRWRRGDETNFNRFWIQTLRFLVEGKLLGGRKRGMISTQREQYALGDSVVVTARALNEKFEPLLLPSLGLRVRLQPDSDDGAGGPSTDAAAGRSVSLGPIPGRDGYYQGRFVPERTGTFRLTVDLPGAMDGGESSDIEKDIVVRRPDIEMRRPAMQRARLRELVAAAGGRYFEVNETGEIADLIEDRSRTFVTRERPRPLWDNRYVLIALVGFLMVEWILRKKAKLL